LFWKAGIKALRKGFELVMIRVGLCFSGTMFKTLTSFSSMLGVQRWTYSP